MYARDWSTPVAVTVNLSLPSLRLLAPPAWGTIIVADILESATPLPVLRGLNARCSKKKRLGGAKKSTK
jgi:hypothetical protein